MLEVEEHHVLNGFCPEEHQTRVWQFGNEVVDLGISEATTIQGFVERP